MDAIEWLLKIPAENHDRPFIMESTSGNQLTFGEVHQEACVVGAKFLSEGFQKGDRVAVLLNNSLDYVKLYFGCLYTGLVVVPINPILSAPEVEYVLHHSRSKALIVSSTTVGQLDVKLLNQAFEIINIDDAPGCLSERGVLWNFETFHRSSDFTPFHKMNGEDELIIVYTSGTTAKPKGVVHKIASIIDNERAFGQQMGIGKSNRFYNCYPMGSLLSYHNLLLLPYVNESSVVLTETFDASSLIRFWETVSHHRVNTLWLVPTVISMLLEMDRDTKGINYCKDNINLVLTGTAPLSVKIRQGFEKKYGIDVYENFALSETLFITTNRPGLPVEDGSAGFTIPKVNIKIIDSQGEKETFEKEGEILVRTPYLMKGYYEEGKGGYLSEKEWFATGDIGYLTEDCQLHITGRKKDLIIRGGFNISPASIEDIIYQHPSVLECAVVGFPDKIKGEKMIGVIRRDSSVNFDSIQKELTQLCQTRLPRVKQPDDFVELEEFPKTHMGKIQKSKLRDWLQKKYGEKPTSEAQYKNQETDLKNSYYYRSSKVVSEIQEALSVRYNCAVYEMKQQGIDVTTLSLGEAYFDIPLFSFDALPSHDLYHYSHSKGIIDLREKLSQYFKSQYEVSFDPENEIIITAGSKVAIYMALLAVINPGDEVVIYEPAWVSYPEQVKLCYGSPVGIPYYEDIFDFEKYITNRTKVIIINNPNNPSGRVFNVEELSHLYHLARKYNLFILSDEAYSDFVPEKHQFISAGNFDRELNHSIIVNSISKNFGISGWRIGYVITNASLTNQILKLNQNLITCPPTILSNYVSQYYDDIIECTLPQISKLLQKRQYVSDYLEELGLKALSGTATFYFFVSIEPSSLTSTEFSDRLLAEDHLCAVPGIGYGPSCDKFIRVSIGAENDERIKGGLQKIKRLIENTTN